MIKTIFKKNIIDEMTKRIITVNMHSKKIVVFPELDDKIFEATSLLIKNKICHPIILGNEDKLRLRFEKLKIKNLSSENFYDYLDEEHK